MSSVWWLRNEEKGSLDLELLALNFEVLFYILVAEKTGGKVKKLKFVFLFLFCF